jgi:hypothetical protein
MSVGALLSRVVAIVIGAQFAVLGAWAMLAPRSFFEAVARFEPYNQHFLQDIGAFQIGLGAVLLLASSRIRADGLTVGLVGVGVGAALHSVSHVIGRDLGGKPDTDIPLLVGIAVVTLAAAVLRWSLRSASRSRE